MSSNRRDRRNADPAVQAKREQFATGNSNNLLGFPPLTGDVSGQQGAGGYGMGLPNAKPASGQQPTVNPFIIPKGTGLNTISQAFPNYFFVEWNVTSCREASNQVILQGWAISWAALSIWTYQSSAFVQSLFGALGRALDQIPFFVVDRNGNQIPEATELMCNKMYQIEIRRYMLFSFFWGFIGLNYDHEREKVYKYPMQNIDPLNQMLRASTFDLGDGVYFEGNDNLLFIQPDASDEGFLGMMQPICRAFVQMNQNDNNMVAVGRRLAFPIMTIGYPQDDVSINKTTGFNQNAFKKEAEDLAANISVETAVVIPYTKNPITGEMQTAMQVDFKAPGSSNGMSKIFTDFNTEKKEEILQMVMGGILTATTGKNGNRSLGDTQERKFDTVVSSMATFVLAIMNGEYKTKCEKFFRGLPKGWKFDYDRARKWTLAEIESLSNVLFQSGLRFTPEFFYAQGLSPDYIEPNPAVQAAPKVNPQTELGSRAVLDSYWMQAANADYMAQSQRIRDNYEKKKHSTQLSDTVEEMRALTAQMRDYMPED